MIALALPDPYFKREKEQNVLSLSPDPYIQVCLRVGPGLYIGGGNEVGATISNGKNPGWTVGVGGDLAIGMDGFGGSVGVNNKSISGSTSLPIPFTSYGIGASAGVEGCTSW